ncbi:MAG: site-specific integrase [Candidatus Bilamarchaeaceae archaeon]
MAVSCSELPVSRRENGGFSVPGNQFPECSEERPAWKAKQISKELTAKWPEIKREMEFLGRYLTKWNLVKAITILSEARKSRFLRRKTPKYGSMNKGFTEEELERFFSVIDDPKLHLLFNFQAIMGLRIGEAVRVNIKDVNLKTRELRIFTEKTGKTDYLLLPLDLFDAVLQYIADYEKEITACKGFLFFSMVQSRTTQFTEPHITTDTARVFFHEYVRKAKLEEIYGYTTTPHPRPLYRLTPHSLRHYAVTNFCRKNGGNVALTAKFARHTNLQTTMIYIHSKKEELYECIERANDDRLLRRVREMQDRI